jgi:hypothetical protein
VTVFVKLLGVFYLEIFHVYVLSCAFDRDRKQHAEGGGRRDGIEKAVGERLH